MRGFWAFARKEAVEIVRTWRIWVLPGIILFFAVTGPVIAQFTPEIVGAMAGSQFGGFRLPDPTYLDSYAQWIKNVSGIAFFALIVIYAGSVSSEQRSGTAVLVLTKPVSRAAFIVAKAMVHVLFLASTIVIGAAITWSGTLLVFGKAPLGPLWSSTAAWLVFGALFVTLMILASVITGSQGGASGIGIGVYALLSLAGLWKPMAEYSPAGLVTGPSMLALGRDSAILWPVVTSLVATVLLVVLAAMVFLRKEL